MAINPAVHDDVILVFVLQHLIERDFVETARCLERESGIYFNMQHFEELILAGRYEEAEDYVHGFTSVEDNRYSTKIIFDIKKLKLLEALDDGARRFAKDIVRNEFPQFTEYNDQIYNQAMELVSMDNYRTHEAMIRFEKTEARRRVLQEMKKCIKVNPAFQGKLELPTIETTLQRLIMLRAQRDGVMGFFPIFHEYWNRSCNN